MTVNPSSPPDPGFPSPNRDRRRVRRWWLIGGSILATVILIGAAAVYAGTRPTDDGRPGADESVRPDAGPQSAPPPLAPALSPTEQPPADRGWAFCLEVQGILSGEFVGLDVDFVESRRAAATQLRELGPPTSAHRAAVETLADELEAVADMVEDDPAAETEADERGEAAVFAFIDNGGCDPAFS